MSVEIALDDVSDAAVLDLIRTHLAFAAQFTPSGSGHALDATALKALTVWCARHRGTPVGCVALKALQPGQGEVKSLHVLAAYRGRGIAKDLMAALEGEARARGYRRLSLETGRGEGFAPSRTLYAALGFSPCAPFGDYVSDAFSYCMTKLLYP